VCVTYTRSEVVAKEAIIVVFICDTHATGCTHPQLREVVGLERSPLSLVGTAEELLERKSSGSGLESREYGRRDPLR
jgi:hypothetical protein